MRKIREQLTFLEALQVHRLALPRLPAKLLQAENEGDESAPFFLWFTHSFLNAHARQHWGRFEEQILLSAPELCVTGIGPMNQTHRTALLSHIHLS